jgi:hypothetical protein
MEDAINRAISRHSDLISNVKKARAELSWDRDAQVLREIYAEVFSEVRS